MVYTDMLHTFASFGHEIYAICPLEKKDKHANYIENSGSIHLLHANIGRNYFNTNTIEKGLSLITLEKGFIKGIKTQFSNIEFDLVLYTTPPITFNKVVEYIKKRDNAMSYLMLKDIFPQNAVDMGMMSLSGIKSIIYRYFRQKEKRLYKVSDIIGCMSEANIHYLLQHNPEISNTRVEMSPNSIIVRDMSTNDSDRKMIRKKYDIPLDKFIFAYGGNLGKPQGIDFLIQCMKKAAGVDALFLIVGDGTEQYKLQEYFDQEKPNHVRLMKRLTKIDYDLLVSSCDVGMIFLDHKFTIPNFPSRLLSYMQAKLPVLAVTDPITDIGNVIVNGNFGWWCESNCADGFLKCVNDAMVSDLKSLGENAYEYLKNHYDVNDSVKGILKHMAKWNKLFEG